MNELLAHESDVAWENVEPHLDTALGELSESDRDALLLRYFERKSAREIAQTLNVSEEAAQKRVSRAVERLREFFSKRNVTIGASGLVVLISANAVQAAPIGLALSISTSVALVATAIQTSTAIATAKTIVMTTLQKTLITVALVAAVGAGIYEARRVSGLQKQIQALRQEQAPLAEHLNQTQSELKNAMNALMYARNENELLKRNTTELPKLRGQVGLLQTEKSNLAGLISENLKLQNSLYNATNDLHFRNPYLGNHEWKERGTDQPIDTLTTMLWAMKRGDAGRLEQLVSRKDDSQSLDSLLLPKNYWDKVQGVQIVDINIVSGGTNQRRAFIGTIVLEQQVVSKVTGDTYNKQSSKRWYFIETNGQWRITSQN